MPPRVGILFCLLCLIALGSVDAQEASTPKTSPNDQTQPKESPPKAEAKKRKKKRRARPDSDSKKKQGKSEPKDDPTSAADQPSDKKTSDDGDDKKKPDDNKTKPNDDNRPGDDAKSEAKKPAKKKSPAKPKAKQPPKPAESPTESPSDKPSEKKPDESQPANQPDEKPQDKPRKKPTGKPAEKPTDKPQEKSVDKPQEKPLPEPARLVAQTLDQVDADFLFQGEYMGVTGTQIMEANRIGLQVVALGNGEFDAVVLRGGLPGAGWDRLTKATLHGKRDGEKLTFTNDPWEITVTGQQAVARQGAAEIQLEKYHRISATQDAPPPAGAAVLFDGRGQSAFAGAKEAVEGLLGVGGLTKFPVGDFQMHLEFRTPYMPQARGQGRGNSGVYIQQRYEVQILDSFGLEGVHDECGGLYKQQRPAVNMCFPPLSWQTYDIYFAAARFDSSGNKVSPARITVLHNGEPIHMNFELANKTGGGKVEGPEPLPILLQNHGNPVAFRNIWLISPIPTTISYGAE